MINLLLLFFFTIIILYVYHSTAVVEAISDSILFEELTLKEAIRKLSKFKKVMLVIGLPIVIVFGLVIYIINSILYFKAMK